MSSLSSASLTEKPIIFNRPNKTNKIVSQVNNTNNRREELILELREELIPIKGDNEDA